MNPQYAFISYSTSDESFVKQLAEEIKKDFPIWIDFWNMDIGDEIPLKIEKGIDGAKLFVLILSKNSLLSRWVQMESHLAYIKLIEDLNFRIVVVHIDDCSVPLRFKPFLYIDCPDSPESAIPKLKDFLKRVSTDKIESIYRRRFVNRNQEIDNIEEYVNDPKIKIITITGFLGIGKLTLVKEAINRLWQKPNISEINLSRAHIGSRLTLDLTAEAGLPMPPDGTSDIDLKKNSLLALEKLVESQRIIIFNNFESLVEDDDCPQKDLEEMLVHLISIEMSPRFPVFVISKRFINFNSINREKIGYLKVAGMAHTHIVSILENETNRILKKEFKDRAILEEIAKQLYGYPLAGKIAAPLLVKYSPEYLLDNLKHFESLRVDIAESILANLRLNENAIQVLELLSIFDGSLSVEALSKVLSKTPEEVMSLIDDLANLNIVECDGSGIKIHPLIQDFYWKVIRSDNKFKEYSSALADFCKQTLSKTKIGTIDYVHWLTNSCRLLFMCGKIDESRALRKDLIGELRTAAIDLYQREEYDLSLKYCEEYLDDEPNDFEINYHKARCLSRLEKFDLAFKAIEALLEKNPPPKKRTRLFYAKGRTFFERYRLEKTDSDLEEAKRMFFEALKYNAQHLSTLQTLGEVLLFQDDLPASEEILNRALTVAPQDAYTLSSYSDVLFKKGDHPEAINRMGVALASQPKNANFLFRMGRFKQLTNKPEEAFGYFEKAVESNPRFFDARLSKASVALDLHRLDVAEKEISFLKDKVSGSKKIILRNIEAGCLLCRGKLQEAEKIGLELIKRNRDDQNLTLMAKIKFEFYKNSKQNKTISLADLYKKEALQFTEEALTKSPTSEYILSLKEKIVSF